MAPLFPIATQLLMLQVLVQPREYVRQPFIDMQADVIGRLLQKHCTLKIIFSRVVNMFNFVACGLSVGSVSL